MNQEEQKELQQKIIELNILDQRCKEIQQQLTLIDQQINDLKVLENNINDVSKIKKDSETLSQLGQGVFVKSKIDDTGEVFIDVGSKIVLKKGMEEAKELIKKRIKQIVEVRELIIRELSNMILTIQLLEKEIQKNIQG